MCCILTLRSVLFFGRVDAQNKSKAEGATNEAKPSAEVIQWIVN